LLTYGKKHKQKEHSKIKGLFKQKGKK